VSLTNQVLTASQVQYNRISHIGPVYFHSVDLQKISTTSTSATISVRTAFSLKYNPNDDFTPVGQWPTTVFNSSFDKTYYDDYHECGRPNTTPNHEGKQAPGYITDMVNRYKAYLNYDPILAVQLGQPSPYDLLVLVNDTTFVGSSIRQRRSPGGGLPDYFYEPYIGNHWDSLLHKRNPNDVTPDDCVDEFNCFKIWTLVNQEGSSSCVDNTRDKCLSVSECNHYYNRLMHCILDTKNYEGYTHFVMLINDRSSNICIGSLCSYWWSFSVVLADQEFLPTKIEDLRTFPEPI